MRWFAQLAIWALVRIGWDFEGWAFRPSGSPQCGCRMVGRLMGGNPGAALLRVDFSPGSKRISLTRDVRQKSRMTLALTTSPQIPLGTTMPEMIDSDVRGPAFTIGPREIPSVSADVDGFGFRAGGGSDFWAGLEVLNRTQ